LSEDPDRPLLKRQGCRQIVCRNVPASQQFKTGSSLIVLVTKMPLIDVECSFNELSRLSKVLIIKKFPRQFRICRCRCRMIRTVGICNQFGRVPQERLNVRGCRHPHLIESGKLLEGPRNTRVLCAMSLLLKANQPL